MRADEAVLGQRQVARLQQLLQRRLVVLRRATPSLPDLVEQRRELADDERARVLDAAVQIDRGDQRLVAVGQQRLLAAAAGLLLAAPEQQVIAEAAAARPAAPASSSRPAPPSSSTSRPRRSPGTRGTARRR